MKILLALGSDPNALPIKAALALHGWSVMLDPDGVDAEQYVEGGFYDAALIDPALPGAGQIVERMRRAAPDLAIMALGVAPSLALKAKLFDAGADDVMSHPVEAREIELRARAIARRRQGHRTPSIRFGDLVVVPGLHAVVAGRRVPLPGSQFAILEFLAMRAGRVVSRDTLLGALYGGRDEPCAKIIDVFMTKLRSNLAAQGVPKTLIGTVWGRGYMVPAPFEPGQPMPWHGEVVMAPLPVGHSAKRYVAGRAA